MRLNKKGEGGYMESMLAVMVVVISLTAFLSFLAYSSSQHSEKEAEMPSDILDDVRIINGQIEADIEGKMANAIERYGYEGMRVILSVSDGIYDSKLTVSVGSHDSDVILSKNGSMIVRSDDGRSVAVTYSMAVWP
jgi:Tfp pilus assembly protein PilV